MERASKKHLERRAGAGLVIVVLVGFGIVRYWPRERLLTDIGRPAARVDPDRQQACWQSDRQLLLLTTKHNQTNPGTYEGPPVTKDWRGSAVLIDTDTGLKTSLPGLTDLLNQIGILPIIGPESFSSPDGSWFLWRSYENGFRGDNSPPPRVARLDGTHFRSWPHSQNEVDFYLNARHLVQIRDHEPVMTVSDLLDPAKDRTYAKLEQTSAVLAQRALQQPVFLSLLPFGSDLSDGDIRISAYRTQDEARLIRAAGNEGNNSPSPLNKTELTLPGSPALYEEKVSLQQTSLLYYVKIARSSRLLVWLHRIVPKFEQKPVVTEELWVSRPDGHGMHVIGHVPPRLNADGHPHDFSEDQKGALENLQWLPNGKHVSFVYRGTLYVVPAEPESP